VKPGPAAGAAHSKERWAISMFISIIQQLLQPEKPPPMQFSSGMKKRKYIDFGGLKIPAIFQRPPAILLMTIPCF
jgi:hypothetical protein